MSSKSESGPQIGEEEFEKSLPQWSRYDISTGILAECCLFSLVSLELSASEIKQKNQGEQLITNVVP